MFVVEGDKMTMIGKRNLRLFKCGTEPQEISPDSDFSFLLKK
jgi:hypothetical protein